MDKNLMDFEANFSVLDRYGTYITKEEYITNPAIGRDQQIKELILVLLTPEKSAILIGKPGIGKTAIVEGLAYRIQQNDVPEALRGYEIVNIKTASLLGTMPSGESKVQKMIDELKTKEKLILFIDEIHMLIGATDSSSLDFANIFKEGLGRGSIKVIGATTTEEYERYILRDKAFTRRFQKIEVPEPSRDETIQIMMGTLPKFEKQTGRKMKYTSFIQQRIMSFLVDITSEYKRVFALGSRYPDVCLTLLKQAFSYTVYDNREYVDIFDIRKAIENSKNIYPDVIKKELPNFDKLFNDIILEEKGEKPVEEWRKDSTPTRKELDEKTNVSDNSSKKLTNDEIENNLSQLKETPEIIDRVDYKENKKLPSIFKKSKFAFVGSTDVSVGLKEKLNRNKNTAKIDDMLLSTDISVIEKKQNDGPVLPSNFVVTDEIRQGVDDSFLLGRPISSMADLKKEPEDKQEIYNTMKKKNEGRHMWNNENGYGNGNGRPIRQDISTQNFDKYNNFFHNNDNNYQQNNFGNPQMMNNGNFGSPNEEEMENIKRMDMLMGKGNSENPGQDGMGMPQNNGQVGPSMGNPPMNNPNMYPNFGNPNISLNNGQVGLPMGNPPMNNPNMYQGFGDLNMPLNNGPMVPPMGNSPMNNQNMYPGFGNPNMPLNNGPMVPPMGNPPMNNQNMYPNFGNPNMPSNNEPMGPQNNFFNNNSNGDNKNETLFGAPMYGENTDQSKANMIPDIYKVDEYNTNNSYFTQNPNYNSNMNMQSNSFLSFENRQQQQTGESIFGAPMYTEPQMEIKGPQIDTSDMVGSLISEDMRIKDGKIVDEFPTFDKIQNLASIKNVIKDVRDSSKKPQNIGQNLSKPSFLNLNKQSVEQKKEVDQPNNLSFIDNQQNQNMDISASSNLQTNILDSVKQQNQNQILSNDINALNNNQNINTSSENFVNLSDLNSGKIKEEDTSKFIGPSKTDNKPKFDLNLENNISSNKTEFDDFYE